MRKIVVSSLSLIMIMATLGSCTALKNTNHKQRGAAGGAAGGAVIGGVIGNNVGKGNNTALGAIIGAVVGGVAGGYIGDRMDRQAERIEEEIPGADVTRVGEGINVTFSEDGGVYFDTNKSAVNTASAVTLDKLVKVLLEYPDTNILVEGHTDSTGSAAYNLNLSKLRAQAVTNYLVANGVSGSRLTTKWYGLTQPKADNSTAEGRAKNRRVELAIVANEALKEEARRQTN
ncbi:OmpA family protein [Arenibacter amylolyticus]|uniref:OmpA family protein n=1 Tax=Arenibacter amylolyticus TaxID=1406873 RepID=UPI000A394010|nr:OmpA family protein [Arenibacter amylolyticus]